MRVGHSRLVRLLRDHVHVSRRTQERQRRGFSATGSNHALHDGVGAERELDVQPSVEVGVVSDGDFVFGVLELRKPKQPVFNVGDLCISVLDGLDYIFGCGFE